MQAQKKISIISACYNEESNVTPLYERITNAMSGFPQYDYEIIIIDNCSTDNTVNILRDIAAADKRVKIILNARNFGALRSGLYVQQFYSGDCMVLMASDLEDPPELIADFLHHWKEGKKVVVAVKAGSKEGFFLRSIRKLYYRIIASISDVKHIRNFTGFGLYDKTIIDPLLDCYDLNTYFRGLISEYAADIAIVEFKKPVRLYGKSSYNFFSYFDYAMTGITSYSKVPIRIATLAGFFLSGLSFLAAVLFFIARLLWWPTAPFGMAPLLIGMFFFSSVQLLFIGLIGEYVSAILVKVSPKPLVTVREFINFEKEEDTGGEV